MSRKIRHKAGKYYSQRKKKKGRVIQPGSPFKQPAATLTTPPAVPPSTPPPDGKQKTVSHPHIATELKTIGIIASIMIVALIVLTLVLT